MSDEAKPGCVSPSEGPIAPTGAKDPTADDRAAAQKEAVMTVMVGKEAPDFGATAYTQGKFKNIKLSEFRGTWVFLCFYPGDFTFV